MKINLFVGFLLLFAYQSYAQNVSYKVLSNAPKIPSTNINLDLFAFEAGFSNFSGMAFSIGSSGQIGIVPKIAATYNLKVGYSLSGANTDIHLGGQYSIMSWTKNNVNTSVILSKTYKGSTYRENQTLKTREEIREYDLKTINVPAKRQKELQARAGVLYKKGGFDMDDIFATQRLTSVGLYGGISLASSKSIIIDTDNYGVCWNSATTHFFADLIIQPVNSFQDFNTGVSTTSDIKAIKNPFPLGYRIGVSRSPADRAAVTGKKLPVGGLVELGYKPYQGFFANAVLSISLFRK